MRFLNRRRQAHQQIDLNVIPLIDVVFFLLIFYVISTSFNQETAVSIQRPGSTQANAISGNPVNVTIVKSGAILVGSQVVDLGQLQSATTAAIKSSNTNKVLVQADRETPTGLLLKVMDECTAAGAAQVDVVAVKL